MTIDTCPEDNAYFHPLKACRTGKHGQCEGRRQPTNHIDPRATVCRCCVNGHYRGEAKVRHTEWQINRNWLRAGDPCKVRGVSSDCVFRALVTNGTAYVEVFDRKAGRTRTVDPDTVSRIAKTKRGGR